jgi:hypothetical protein
MAFYKRASGAWVSAVPKKRVGGSMVDAASLLVREGGAWVQKLAMILSLNRTTVSGVSTSYPVVTPSVTCTATGGSGAAKTFAWTWASGGTSITIDAASSATTTFRITTGTERTGTARCTVSDGTFTSTIDIPVTIIKET